MSKGIPEMLLLRDPGKTARPARQPEQPAKRTRRQNEVALAGVPLFGGISKKHLRAIAAETDEQLFQRGQIIVEEGMPGETLYVVLEGQAKVMRNKRKVGQVIPGDFFGELSAIDGGARSASVVAETPMRLLRLFRHTLVDMVNTEPDFSVRLLDGMVGRLRQIAGAGL
ncbi:MAG: family transcriptional regulator, cyclic receptor protein [Actinomycetota bacterium]|jgi:CRP-like cAMP-binding protein|nr:family transcriptional regulator, cyclic receptor protein [Actinomycetota bacterium]MEA2580335.1 family transcriptional regulator, cyclic receptor protein [Actinomycetota bacterium]